MQEVATERSYLRDYLCALPVDEIGVPAYHPELSRQLKKLKVRNLIYPIGGDLFIHIYPDPVGERDFWVPIEPSLPLELNGLMQEVEMRLLDMAVEIGQAEEEERREAFLRSLDKILTTGRRNGGKLRVTPQEREAIEYLVLRDKTGVGILQPFLEDPYIEDISCSGVGPVFIEHKIFKSLRAAVVFSELDELDDFVVWLGARIKRPVTLRHPIVDATLPDGSRINIVYGRDIAKRGSNFTIRKFSETPLSIVQLIDFGTLNSMMGAYLWMILQEGMNVFVVGPTASGKTTTLNAITTFISADAKVVSIEDTPEVQVPHKNWVREVVREMGESGSGSAVGIFDLLKAALRQRPELILIGEIRGAEGNVAFQAMQTGHAVMATFHAASVQKLIQRLTGDPINVPKPVVDNLDVVVIQAAVRGPDGSMLRRILSINEIVDYDPASHTYSFITAFRWNPGDDTFEFPGDMSSYLLEEKIAARRGIARSDRKAIYLDLKRRAGILEKLRKRGVTHFDKLFNVLAEAQKQGLV